MELIGLSKNFYEERMKAKIPYEKKFKQQRILLIVSVIYSFVGTFLNFYVPATAGNMIIILLLSCSFPAIICFSVYLYQSYKNVKPFWDLMKLYEKPDHITVFPDFHMEIKSYTGNYIDMSSVHSFRRNFINRSLMVEYSYGNNGGSYPLKYEISFGMKDFVTIENLLKFKMELQKGGDFVNESMKKVFHMEPSLRNRLFIDELNSGELLLPICLAEKLEYNEHCLPLFNDIYVMYEVDKQDYLCMYTSMQEISKQTQQAYPQCIHINVKKIYSLLIQNYSSIFNESTTDFFITINRHNEKVNLSRIQLSKMLTVQEEDHVSQLYNV